MKCLLACSHTQDADLVRLRYPAHLLCEQPGHEPALYRLIAVECREWHVKCHNCRHGKWCGQSRETADQDANWHGTTHPQHYVTMDYLTPDAVKKAYRVHYPRSVKLRIDDVVPMRDLYQRIPNRFGARIQPKPERRLDDIPPY